MSVSVENLAPLLLQLLAQLAEILDDAVVHHRDLVGRVRMGIDLVRPPMRRPARVPDADRAGERFEREALLEILQLAFGAPARQVAALQRRDAGGIVAAIFEALQRLDHFLGDRLAPQYSNDPTHDWKPSPIFPNNVQIRFN